MTEAVRPAPVPRGEEIVFYDRLRAHELVFQRCAECDRVVFPLRTICPGCGGEQLGLEVSAGRGVVYSFTAQHRAASPFFADHVPYTLALAEMDEGFRVLGSVPEPDGIAVGGRLEAGFDDVTPELTLLSFGLEASAPSNGPAGEAVR